MNNPTKVVVGMSGGVDSSVTAYLLKEQGYHVEGLFMKNWEDDDTADFCAATEDKKDAQSVCDQLGIKLHTVNFSYEYWERVFADCLDEFNKGRTPNPDILCNREIKFKEFLQYAIKIDADYIATGHYARSNTDDYGAYLQKGLDPNKDQSYFLYAIQQEAIKKTIFPVGNIEKTEVREIAAKMGFVTHDKKDSTGLCFIGERKFTEFLNQYIDKSPGDIVDENNNIVGKHYGLMFYTIGQRKGLGIGGAGEAWYVSGKNLDNNTLHVVQGHNHIDLMSKYVKISQIHKIQPDFSLDQLDCTAKTRYRQNDQPCKIIQIDSEKNEAIFEFNHLQRAVTPGQSLVMYLGDKCLGGGIIESCSKNNNFSSID